MGRAERTESMKQENNIINLIIDYQSSANEAVTIFKRKHKVTSLLKGWHSGLYEQTGNIKEDGLRFYAFHGFGLAAHFANKIVDFDFAFFPEERWDGFDLWRLRGFVENQPQKYEAFLKPNFLEDEFEQLKSIGKIKNPKLEQQTSLYFWTKDIPQHLTEKVADSNNTYSTNKTRDQAQPIWERIVKRGFTNYHKLTQDERVWFNIEALITSGLWDHYVNGGADKNADTIEDLEYLNFSSIANLLREFNKVVFPNGVPQEPEARQDKFNELLEEDLEKQIDKMEDVFANVSEELKQVLQKHINKVINSSRSTKTWWKFWE